jgi:diacylglycerol kinase (ATP)
MGLLSFVIAYLLLAPKLEAPIQNGFERLKGADWYISFFTLLFVIAAVIVIKTIFHRGKPLRGGLPSGHAALAFSIWMMITLLKSDPLLSILVFLLALMISASRLKEGIHNLLEVFLGAILGVLITILIFQLLGG